MDKISDQKTIVVLGWNRGGTSMIAGLLQILGVFMGDILIGKDRFNPNGHFEDYEFLAINRKILKSVGADYDQPPTPKQLTNEGQFDREIESLMKKRQGVWGWKDPRTVLTIDFFMPHIINPHFVFCFRNPYDSALSLHERASIDLIRCLNLTLNYYQAIMRCIEKYPNVPRLFLSYEQIASKPLTTALSLQSFIDLPLITKKREREIKGFIVTPKEISGERIRVQRDLERNLIRKNQEMIQRLEELVKELVNMRKSLSWKITVPLRWVKSEFSRLR